MRKHTAHILSNSRSPLWIGSFFLVSLATFGQTLPAPATTTEVAVDGAVTPYLISDDIAFSHLFQILMLNPASKEPLAESTRRESYARHYFSNACGVSTRTLTLSQIGKLLVAVDKATPQYLATYARMIASKSQGEYDTLAKSSQLVAVKTFKELDDVDPDLALKVRAHTSEHVKSRIKILSAKVPQK